jgi:triacylglycerol lipase
MRPLSSLAAALALAAITACGGSLTDPLSAPESASLARKPKPTPPPPPPITHTPVLFVHGWNASASTWSTMVGRFKADGYIDRELANFSYSYNQSNATTAGIIAQKVDSIIAATGATKVSIVTHSMGALSARYYVKNLGGLGKVDALITLGGTNHGTNTAIFCFSTACSEMRVNSTFVNALNATDETPGTTVRYATWYSPCDEVINPLSSALLDGATNTQTACIPHSDLHENATVYGQVRDWVNVPPVAAVLLASAPM